MVDERDRIFGLAVGARAVGLVLGPRGAQTIGGGTAGVGPTGVLFAPGVSLEVAVVLGASVVLAVALGRSAERAAGVPMTEWARPTIGVPC